jgi:serine/threonine protein kinase
LSDNLEPKQSDFGLARLLGMEETKVFTDVRRTIGYMDPEYMSNAKLTCASDIYSFGIVALQLLSGRKVIELDLDARDQLTRMVILTCVLVFACRVTEGLRSSRIFFKFEILKFIDYIRSSHLRV